MSSELVVTYLTPSIRVGNSAGLSTACHVGHGNSTHPLRGWDSLGYPLSAPEQLLSIVICILAAPPILSRDVGPGGSVHPVP